MPNRKYEAGARLERETVKNLKDNGYVAFRAAGSKGIADVIAFKPGQVLFVQAKTKTGAISPGSRHQLLMLARMIPGGVPLVVTRPKTSYQKLITAAPGDSITWYPDEVGE